MAEKTTKITLKWENGKYFEMRQKDDTEDIVVIHVDEDGNIASLWENIVNICKQDFIQHLKKIGDDMAS